MDAYYVGACGAYDTNNNVLALHISSLATNSKRTFPGARREQLGRKKAFYNPIAILMPWTIDDVTKLVPIPNAISLRRSARAGEAFETVFAASVISGTLCALDDAAATNKSIACWTALRWLAGISFTRLDKDFNALANSVAELNVAFDADTEPPEAATLLP